MNIGVVVLVVGVLRNPSILPWILSTHLNLIARSFASFPEPAAGFADQDVSAYTTGLWPVDLFSGAEPTVENIPALVKIVFAIRRKENQKESKRSKGRRANHIIRFPCSLGWSISAS